MPTITPEIREAFERACEHDPLIELESDLIGFAAGYQAANAEGWVSETPTNEQKVSVCFSMRHDFGLMGPVEREKMMSKAGEWWRAIAKEINCPSQHPYVAQVASGQTITPPEEDRE